MGGVEAELQCLDVRKSHSDLKDTLLLSLNFLEGKCSITAVNDLHKNNTFHEIPATMVLKNKQTNK